MALDRTEGQPGDGRYLGMGEVVEEGQFQGAAVDFGDRARSAAAVEQGGQQHQHDVLGGAVEDQGMDRRIAGVTPVPVGLAVDLHGMVQSGEAG